MQADGVSREDGTEAQGEIHSYKVESLQLRYWDGGTGKELQDSRHWTGGMVVGTQDWRYGLWVLESGRHWARDTGPG